MKENYILKKLVLRKYIMFKMFIKTFQKMFFSFYFTGKMMISR